MLDVLLFLSLLSFLLSSLLFKNETLKNQELSALDMVAVTYRLGDVEGTPDYLIPLHDAIPALKDAETKDIIDFHGRALPVLAARDLCVSAEQLWDDFSRLRGNTDPFPFQVHASFEKVTRENLMRLNIYDIEDRARPELRRFVAQLTHDGRPHFGDILVRGALPDAHSFSEYPDAMEFSEAVACFPVGSFIVQYHLLFDQRGFEAWTRHAAEEPEEHEDMLVGLEQKCFF